MLRNSERLGITDPYVNKTKLKSLNRSFKRIIVVTIRFNQNELTMTLTEGLRVLMTTPHDAMRPPPPTGKRTASKSGTFD